MTSHIRQTSSNHVEIRNAHSLGQRAMQPYGQVTMDSVERCLLDEGSRDYLNLEECKFVDPFGLVTIACQAQFAVRRGQTTYSIPRERTVAIYQERMRLPRVLENEFGLHPTQMHEVREHDQQEILSELTVFSNWSQVEPMATMVLDRLDASEDSAQAIWLCLAEACENVGEHSGARGFVAAQTYQRGQPDEYVVLAVGDTGFGIRATLRRAFPNIVDDHEALSLVIKGGHSGIVEDPDRGTGIHSMITAVKELGGRAVLRTGSQSVSIYPKSTNFLTSGHLRGTIIGLRLPCSSRLKKGSDV